MRHWVWGVGWGVEETYISEDPGGRAFSYPENKTAGSEPGDLREIPDFWIKEIWILSFARPRDKAYASTWIQDL